MLQLPDSSKLVQSTRPSEVLPLPSSLPESKPRQKIGLDAEALWWDFAGGSLPGVKLALCFSFGTVATGIETIEAWAPGRFEPDDLNRLAWALSDSTVVGHNAFKYDLPLLSGVLLDHKLPPLPLTHCVDTMNEWKTGMAYANTLKAQCRKYGINLKTGAPDWRRIIENDRDEWQIMVEYCENDVVCALELEVVLAEHGIPCPERLWRPRK